jgi:peroxiredoxin
MSRNVPPVLLFLLASSVPVAAAPKLDRPAPTFALRDLEGALISLADLAYAGPQRPRRPKQVVVLDFFRTDCKPCRQGLPRLAALHRKLGGKGLRVLLIALLEEDEGQEKLERFLRAHPLPFPVLVDPYAVAGKRYVAKNGGMQIPALFVIDRQGVLRGRFAGLSAKAQAQLEALLARLLR